MPTANSPARSEPVRTSVTTPELVGRDDELRAVDDLLGRAGSGPVALVLEGDAGIGKTTLWRAGLHSAGARDFEILSATAGRAEASLAFAGLADLLDPVRSDLLAQLPRPQRRALETALLIDDDPNWTPEPRAIAAAFLGALRALAARRPTVLAVDDIQWLDAPSAAVLRYGLRRLAEDRVGVLLTRRSRVPTRPPFDLDRSEFAQRVDLLRLGPLSPGALHRLIRERVGTALPRPVLTRVHATSGGNPFFALELARELRRADARPIAGEPLPVPETLRGLLDGRIARLSPDVREALLVVAALPDPRLAQIETLLGPAGVERLHVAADAELVEIRGARIHFTHPLLASRVCERAAPSVRRRIHRTLADLVVTAEERARQLALGADAPDEHVAAALDDAARRSAGRGAPETAAELCEQARRLTPPQRHADLIRRSIAAGRYHLAAGDTARARAVLERALGDSPDGGLRARARHGLAWAAFRDSGWAEFARLLEQALEEASESSFRCQLELDLTGALMQSDELLRAMPHAERATELARRTARPDLLATALSYRAMAETLLGKGAPIELVREGLGAAAVGNRPSGRDVAGDVPPELGFGTVLKWAGEFADARRLLDRLRRRLEDAQAHARLPPTLYQLAELECWAGEWQRAGELATACLELAEQVGSTTLEPVALHARALVYSLWGLLDAAREIGSAGLERSEQTANLRHRIRFHALLGFTELSAGEAAAARRHLTKADELATGAGYGEPAVFRFQQDHIESCLMLGELESAEALVERLEAHAEAVGCAWCCAIAARGRALVSATRGDLEAAVQQLEEALTVHDRLGQPFERARTMLALGAVQRRARRRGLAREALTEAIAVFDELGATLWGERARADIGRLGGRRAAGGQLTPAEAKIARLVAEGRSNKEVAAELFLAPKTVETQLTRIYAKLGVHSRMGLANHLARRGEQTEM